MQKTALVIFCILLISSCKKSDDRACFKSFGEPNQIDIPIDSVERFNLYKGITYHVYQDTLKLIRIIGGKNVIEWIEVNKEGNELDISNKNKCNFLRNYNKQILVEIHYPTYYRFYSETSDSLLFKDTIQSNYLYVEQALGGGHVGLNITGQTLVMIASNGVGSYQVGGQVNHADLRIQSGARGNAENLIANSIEIDQNSTGDLYINGTNSTITVNMKGTGNVYYLNAPTSISIVGIGAGKVLSK